MSPFVIWISRLKLLSTLFRRPLILRLRIMPLLAENRAVMRTWVAPHSTAIGISPDIPIDKTSASTPAVQLQPTAVAWCETGRCNSSLLLSAFGHTHQSAHFNIRQLGQFPGQRNRFIGCHTVFRLFRGAMFTSMHTRNGGISDGLCSPQAPRRFQTTVCTQCAFGHKFGFIDRTSPITCQTISGKSASVSVFFFKPFLNIVLAKIALTGRIHFADIVRRKRLADRHQLSPASVGCPAASAACSTARHTS